MASIRLADVDDYISPSQACINPLFTSAKDSKDKTQKNKKTKSPFENNNGADNGGLQVAARRRRRRRTPLIISAPQSNVKPKPSPPVGSVSRGVNANANARKLPPKLEFDTMDTDIIGMSSILPTTNSPPILEPSVPITKPSTNSKATISVADCLACSGCITSSEAVLVSQHSVDALLQKAKALQDEELSIVFTVSPAALADLTRVMFLSNVPTADISERDVTGGGNDVPPLVGTRSTNGLELRQDTLGKLSAFLKRAFPNTVWVMDGSIPEQISLIESALEFCRRYNVVEGQEDEQQAKGYNEPCSIHAHQKEKDKSPTTSFLDPRINLTTPSIALSSRETRYLIRKEGRVVGTNNDSSLEAIVETHEPGINSRIRYLHDSPTSKSSSMSLPARNKILPMLSSSCPGFVCYVEKSVSSVVPNLCTVKSPMAIAGTLYKQTDACKKANLLEQYGLQDMKLASSMDTDVDVIKDSDSTNEHGLKTQQVYHVAIMPCHDKKLEAERKDLAWDQFNQEEDTLVPDVDLVITTSELLDIMIKTLPDIEGVKEFNPHVDNTKDLQVNLRSFFKELQVDNIICDEYTMTQGPMDGKFGTSRGVSSNHSLMGSGGYADFIFRFAAHALFGFNIPLNEVLPWKKVVGRRGRRVSAVNMDSKQKSRTTSDFSELCLYRKTNGTFSFQQSNAVSGDKVVLRFAVAYGFTNIQRVIKKITAGENSSSDNYHFIEVMACPSGCLNGGGQIKDTHDFFGKETSKRESLLEVRNRVQANEAYVNTPFSKAGTSIPDDRLNQCPTQLVHTQFHVVPKMELSTGATTGVALDDTIW